MTQIKNATATSTESEKAVRLQGKSRALQAKTIVTPTPKVNPIPPTILMREIASYPITGGANQIALSQSEKIAYVASTSATIFIRPLA